MQLLAHDVQQDWSIDGLSSSKFVFEVVSIPSIPKTMACSKILSAIKSEF